MVSLNSQRRTIKKFLLSPLEGREVLVVSHTDTRQVGVSGKIIEETYNTLVIAHGGTSRTVSKQEGIFKFQIQDQDYIVRGNLLVGKPKHRRKRKLKNW